MSRDCDETCPPPRKFSAYATVGKHGHQTDVHTELLQKIRQQEAVSRQIGE